MNELTSTYSEFKQELDKAMHQAAEAFVKIGYLLRKAKETDVLSESGYENVNEFAKGEYGLSPDQVSRYSLNPLWINTALKQVVNAMHENASLNPLWINTALKQKIIDHSFSTV